LGLLFPSTNAAVLSERIREVAEMPRERRAVFESAATGFAKIYSREAYRLALLRAVSPAASS
jgi:hypothetical protein